jgi:hypothetical protein
LNHIFLQYSSTAAPWNAEIKKKIVVRIFEANKSLEQVKNYKGGLYLAYDDLQVNNIVSNFPDLRKTYAHSECYATNVSGIADSLKKSYPLEFRSAKQFTDRVQFTEDNGTIYNLSVRKKQSFQGHYNHWLNKAGSNSTEYYNLT